VVKRSHSLGYFKGIFKMPAVNIPPSVAAALPKALELLSRFLEKPPLEILPMVVSFGNFEKEETPKGARYPTDFSFALKTSIGCLVVVESDEKLMPVKAIIILSIKGMVGTYPRFDVNYQNGEPSLLQVEVDRFQGFLQMK
jgi:hypothetical protein